MNVFIEVLEFRKIKNLRSMDMGLYYFSMSVQHMDGTCQAKLVSATTHGPYASKFLNL